jgi:hypothetical protein
MKTNSSIAHGLLALLTLGLAAPASAFSWGGKLDMLVVAEQTDPAAAPAPPTAAMPARYLAFDGGYIESGDPIGGVHPPPAAAVAQALASALATRHYLPATAEASPSLVLLYHWGLINRDSHQIRTSIQLQPNLVARIGLVAPARYAARIEEDLRDRRQPVAMRTPIIDPVERDLIQYAADDRIFVIVSAYDYASVADGQAKLLWRTKLSTLSAGASMAEAVPTLLQGGAPYFGRDLSKTQGLSAPIAAAVATPSAVPAPPPEFVRRLNQAYLDGLIHQEHVKFAGNLPGDDPS